MYNGMHFTKEPMSSETLEKVKVHLKDACQAFQKFIILFFYILQQRVEINYPMLFYTIAFGLLMGFHGFHKST